MAQWRSDNATALYAENAVREALLAGCAITFTLVAREKYGYGTVPGREVQDAINLMNKLTPEGRPLWPERANESQKYIVGTAHIESNEVNDFIKRGGVERLQVFDREVRHPADKAYHTYLDMHMKARTGADGLKEMPAKLLGFSVVGAVDRMGGLNVHGHSFFLSRGVGEDGKIRALDTSLLFNDKLMSRAESIRHHNVAHYVQTTFNVRTEISEKIGNAVVVGMDGNREKVRLSMAKEYLAERGIKPTAPAIACASCHVLYGQGSNIGPDLTGSNRKQLDYLLEYIIDPSASVGADFRAVLFSIEDGRILSGVVREQSERTLTIQTAQEVITLERDQILESKPTTTSLMPDGLLQNLTKEQIRHLIGYLGSSGQAPLP